MTHDFHDLHDVKVGKMNNELYIGFSTLKMPKNDTHDHISTELLIFHHRGHDLYDLHDLAVSVIMKMIMVG